MRIETDTFPFTSVFPWQKTSRITSHNIEHHQLLSFLPHGNLRAKHPLTGGLILKYFSPNSAEQFRFQTPDAYRIRHKNGTQTADQAILVFPLPLPSQRNRWVTTLTSCSWISFLWKLISSWMWSFSAASCSACCKTHHSSIKLDRSSSSSQCWRPRYTPEVDSIFGSAGTFRCQRGFPSTQKSRQICLSEKCWRLEWIRNCSDKITSLGGMAALKFYFLHNWHVCGS